MDAIARWANDSVAGRAFVAHRVDMGRDAEFGAFPAWVSAPVVCALRARGIVRPYSHQARALEYIGDGRHVVVATPTASGKSLVYNTPVLTSCLSDSDARALYLFPTKALAHDQTSELNALAGGLDAGIAAHPYDGDTPADARRAIRTGARVVITNPDMLHTGILPHHSRWQGLFSGLRYVVLDEVHTYRGVFGTHVANVLRRLRRVAAFHGSEPQFIACSATIANAAEHVEALIEGPVAAVLESGAPRGSRSFYIYNPPIVDGERGIRQSYVQAARRVARALMRERVPTIVFANSRINVERLTRHLREDATKDGRDPELVAGYRGGYLPEHRRTIEKGLREGRIRTVVATSALELGIDIGQLEACVLAGYPGSIASARQRAGRAGRRDVPATVILVARSEPVDQYIAAHPEFFFERSPEHARVDPDNLLVVADHIKCAAFELPFDRDEGFGRFAVGDTQEVLGYLADHRVVFRAGRRWNWTAEPFPAHKVALRAIAEGNFVVFDRNDGHKAIGEVDYFSAATTIYPQAIYIVGGETYQVMRLDWEGRRADVEPVRVDYYTDAMTYGGVRILEAFDERKGSGATIGHGDVHVFERAVGFKKIRYATGENVGYGDIDLPDTELHTTAVWWQSCAHVPAELRLTRSTFVDALEGVAHALRHVAAVRLMCEPADLGTAVVDAEGDEAFIPEALPTLFVYERYPGGVGYHDALFDGADDLLRATVAVLDRCECGDGCPGCVGAPAPLMHPEDHVRSRVTARRVVHALIDASKSGAAAV